MAQKTWAATRDARTASLPSDQGAGACAHLPVGTYGGFDFQSHIGFAVDWSGIPSAAAITGATLYLYRGSNYHVAPVAGTMRARAMVSNAGFVEGTASHPMTATNGGGIHGSTRGTVDSATAATWSQPTTLTYWQGVDITAMIRAHFGESAFAVTLSADSGITEYTAREVGGGGAYVLVYYEPNQAPVIQSMDSPGNGDTITDDTPNLVFTVHDPDAGDTVNYYDIQVDGNSDMSSPEINLADQAIGSPANTVQVTHTASALSRATTWYWRARCKDNKGLLGAWGPVRQFYLASVPTVDTFSPSGNGLAYIHNLGDTALWTDGAFAKARLRYTYHSTSGLSQATRTIRIYDAATAGTKVYDSGAVAHAVANGTQVSVDVNFALPRNTSRWWTVQVTDSAGGDSGESARQQFRVQWGEAVYEANPGAGSAAWSFAQGAIAGGYAGIAFRTATAAGGGGTTSAWVSNIGALTPAAYLNVLVRLAPTTAGTNVTLGSLDFTYMGASTVPDNWVRSPSGEWALSTAERRFGAKSVKCNVAAGTTGDRLIYPYRNTSGDDIPVVPGVTYTWSAYVKTEAPLTGGSLSVRVYPGGSLATPLTADPGRESAVVTDTSAAPDGWQRLTMTVTVPDGLTTVRPVIHYQRASGVTEAFYVDGTKFEEGPVATPWTAGVIGAVNLDSGGIQVDALAGGTLRLRGSTGGVRDSVELGPHGLLFGGDTELWTPSAGDMRLEGPGGVPTWLGLIAPAGQRAGIGAAVAGDSAPRLGVYGDATGTGIYLGGGGGAFDVSLVRQSAGVARINGLLDIVDGAGQQRMYPVYTYADANSTAYLGDSEISQNGAGLIFDDGNNCVGIMHWFRGGTYNTAVGVGAGGIGFRGMTYSADTTAGTFSVFIESNSAGARLGIRNNNGYGRGFYVMTFQGV